MGLEGVRCIVPVFSGKGGVGKSTVSASIATALALKGHSVGILDIDLCGPSIPKIFGVSDARVMQSQSGWIPVQVQTSAETPAIAVMSIAFLLPNKDDSVVWRGPKKTAIIKQFLNDVNWGNLDYLVIDTPPGTSDEHLSLAEFLQFPQGASTVVKALIVSTPQWVSLSDVMKEIDFCRKTNIPMAGLIENMNDYICPNCKSCFHLFSSGGAQKLAEQAQLPLLASIPIDPPLGAAMESKASFTQAVLTCISFEKIKLIADLL